MATMVGTQKSFTEAIKELVELDYDALGAYEAAINNLENPEYKRKFEEFKLDHQRHITELTAFLSRCNETAPSGPDNIKKILVKGKVELASLFGDQDILKAMLSNEEDTKAQVEQTDDPCSGPKLQKSLHDLTQKEQMQQCCLKHSGLHQTQAGILHQLNWHFLQCQ